LRRPEVIRMYIRANSGWWTFSSVGVSGI
jgi:hypothetical protein